MKTKIKFPQKNSGLFAILMIALLSYNPMYAQTKTTASSAQSSEEITVKGSHFIQEDSPHDIGKAISSWYQKI